MLISLLMPNLRGGTTLTPSSHSKMDLWAKNPLEDKGRGIIIIKSPHQKYKMLGVSVVPQLPSSNHPATLCCTLDCFIVNISKTNYSLTSFNHGANRDSDGTQ